METKNKTTDSALLILLKEPFAIHTATSISKSLGVTRQGIWKALNKLAENKLIRLEPISSTKTSTTTIKLNWPNPVTEKTLSLLLTEESLRQQRWRVNFAELESYVEFLMIFGSVLNNPKEANDIDIIAIVEKKNFKAADEITARIQQTQLKKIHLVDLTVAELAHELKKPNKVYLDAIKKGIILYGQDNFIKFMAGLTK